MTKTPAMTMKEESRLHRLFGRKLQLKQGKINKHKNKIFFINKHKLLPVQLTCLPQVYKKMLFFANKHPGVLVLVCLIIKKIVHN